MAKSDTLRMAQMALAESDGGLARAAWKLDHRQALDAWGDEAGRVVALMGHELALPASGLVFRAQAPHEPLGWSWTLDERVALGFMSIGGLFSRTPGASMLLLRRELRAGDGLASFAWESEVLVSPSWDGVERVELGPFGQVAM